MAHWRNNIAACAGSILLTSCVSPYLVHDPQTIIGRQQVRDFLKSVRCELKTFYDANRVNQVAYIREIKRAKATPNPQVADSIRANATVKYPHFMMDNLLAGGTYLYLKVVDTIGVGAADVNLTQKRTVDATHSGAWSLAPTLNTQNTYDMNYSFAINQATGLSNVPADSTDEFRCYSIAVSEADLEQLAFGSSDPRQVNFNRIYLNGVEPLAGWLMKNSRDLWTSYAAKSDAELVERIFPLQMNYSFTILFNAGIGGKYSLTSPVWSPLQIGGGGSIAQTSQIALYFNGTNSPVALNAKTGSATFGSLLSEEERMLLLAQLRDVNRRIADLQTERTTIAQRVGVDANAPPSAIENRIQSLIVDPARTDRSNLSADSDRIKSIQNQTTDLQKRRNAIQARIGRRSNSVYGVEGGRLLYPAAIPPPQVFIP